MRYGIDVPNFGSFSDIHELVALAQEAEQYGWDGFFLWDHIYWSRPEIQPLIDPWVALSAIAAHTSRITIGALVTPLSRRRPWQIARITTTLDQLSNGRLIFAVGLGGDTNRELSAFDEETDDRRRAAMLDEGLAVLTGLWSGEPFSFNGEHYQVNDMQFTPTPVQQPRIPIWVAGVWPNKAPFRRAAHWDGVFPIAKDSDHMPAELFPDILQIIAERRRDSAPFDVVAVGTSHGLDAAADAALIQPYADAGVTWWVEGTSDGRDTIDSMRERIRRGPPRLE